MFQTTVRQPRRSIAERLQMTPSSSIPARLPPNELDKDELRARCNRAVHKALLKSGCDDPELLARCAS